MQTAFLHENSRKCIKITEYIGWLLACTAISAQLIEFTVPHVIAFHLVKVIRLIVSAIFLYISVTVVTVWGVIDQMKIIAVFHSKNMKMLTVYMFSAVLIIVSVCVCECIDILCSQLTWMNVSIANGYNFKSAHVSVNIKPFMIAFVFAHLVKNKTIIQYYSNLMTVFFVCLFFNINSFCYVYFSI